MDKPEEISPTGFDPEPASRSSVVDPSSSDLSEQLRNVGLDETANEQSGTMSVSEACRIEGNDSKAEDGDCEEEGGGNGDEGWSEDENEIERRRAMYPVRPEAEDCAFYMRTGSCKYGSSCKFNHPVRTKIQASRDNAKEKDDDTEKLRQIECKYYFRTGGCKYGESCRFSHSKSKTSLVSELNFLGLPIRLGEKECPFYMRNGSCKFGADCKFNHPDPTTIGGNESPSFYGNGGSAGSFSPKAASQASSTSWSSSRHLNGTAPFMPVMFSQSRRVPSQTSEWTGYQASVYSPERSVLPASPYLVKNSSSETSIYPQYQLQMPVDEFPERPDQPECSYYLKTGDCKFKYKCKYHHPKNRLPKQPPCALNDKGLPLRPDQSLCAHYSRYGICKFGPACKFDHSVQPPCSTGSPQAMEAPQVDANGNESDGWN
ncbi:PREDICTED: zinc finger CCCH domain-containing protein 43-like [Tarenaya hassleriana]|uniref:zinc finger CCCH domain-containing protein 43-like n=1 Tax=Tarenaya hassleriana TaxID=28532 RepID=UPI00053C9CF3|nr:PREDICTED: zinc finger CCCH domain-containing protein 43-like [Tarenaya hassleriana]